ncbi:lysophospholipid acyltransferase family protein [Draconibacterium sp.]|nr:lysophospholipid acyltransferase family protein [Draconibacterium sp.]
MTNNKLRKNDNRFYESPLKRAINGFLVGVLILISYLPFWFIYGLSDIIYLLLTNIIRYRYKVITQNLKNAFPEKSKKEITRIRNKFYRHFCDLFFEAIKLYSMTEKELTSRFSIKGVDLVNKYFDEGKSIIAFAFHHNNWEWCSYLAKQTKHLVLMVYNPVRGNHAMEKFLLHSRGKWGGEAVPVHKTARTTISYNLKGQLTGLWLAADQTPLANSKFWTIFLNQETPFFSGPEKIATKTNQPVFFQHVRKLKRGHYEVEYSLLFEEPQKVAEKEILLLYIRKMEEIIKQEPEYYLWSHRRWKHIRPEGIPLTT